MVKPRSTASTSDGSRKSTTSKSNIIEESPYEQEERAELGEPLFEQFNKLLLPATPLGAGGTRQLRGRPKPSQKAIEIFGDEEMAMTMMSSSLAVIDSLMLYSPSWLVGQFPRVKQKPLPRHMLLLCLQEVRLSNLSETNVMDLMVNDFGVYDLTTKLLDEWHLRSKFPGLYKLLSELPPSGKRHPLPFKSSTQRLESHKSAMFVARAYQIVEVLRPRSVSKSLREKVESCLSIMWHHHLEATEENDEMIIDQVASASDSEVDEEDSELDIDHVGKTLIAGYSSTDNKVGYDSCSSNAGDHRVMIGDDDDDDDDLLSVDEEAPIELCSRSGFVLHRFDYGLKYASAVTSIRLSRIRRQLIRSENDTETHKKHDFFWRFASDDGKFESEYFRDKSSSPTPVSDRSKNRREFDSDGDPDEEPSREKKNQINSECDSETEASDSRVRVYKGWWKRISGESTEPMNFSLDEVCLSKEIISSEEEDLGNATPMVHKYCADSDEPSTSGDESYHQFFSRSDTDFPTRQGHLTERELLNLPRFTSNEFQIIWSALEKYGWKRSVYGKGSYFSCGTQGRSIMTPKLLMRYLETNEDWSNNVDVLEAIEAYRIATQKKEREDKERRPSCKIRLSIDGFTEKEIAHLSFKCVPFQETLWPGLKRHGWDVARRDKRATWMTHPDFSGIINGVRNMMKRIQNRDEWREAPWFQDCVAEFKRKVAEDIQRKRSRRGIIMPKRKRSHEKPKLTKKKVEKITSNGSPRSPSGDRQNGNKLAPGPARRNTAEVWSFLEKQGWTMIQRKLQKFFFPPGITEKTGKHRIDYFDSMRQAFSFAVNDERWASMEEMQDLKARYPSMLKPYVSGRSKKQHSNQQSGTPGQEDLVSGVSRSSAPTIPKISGKSPPATAKANPTVLNEPPFSATVSSDTKAVASMDISTSDVTPFILYKVD